MRNNWLAGAILVSTSLLFSAPAYAYKTGVVSLDGAELKQGPGTQYKTVQRLKSGTRVTATDQPRNGYYGVRTATGKGWVEEGSLRLQGVPATGPRVQDGQQPRRRAAPAEKPKRTARRSSSAYDTWAIKLLWNMNMYKSAEIATQIGSTSLNNGVGIGTEIHYAFGPRWSLGLRAESVGASFTGRDTTTGNTYEFSLKSMPIQVGAGYLLSRSPDLVIQLGLFGGFGLSTKLSATATNLAAPNITEYSNSAITGMLKVDAAWVFSKPFALVAEAGYRYLKTSELTASPRGSGQEIFESNSAILKLPINMSGIFFGAGLQFIF